MQIKSLVVNWYYLLCLIKNPTKEEGGLPDYEYLSRQMVPQHCVELSIRRALTVTFLVACSRLFPASPLSTGCFLSQSETAQIERGSVMASPVRSGEAGEGRGSITWGWWGDPKCDK